MAEQDFSYRSEQPGDAPAIDALLDHAFGPGRHVLTAYRLREGSRPVGALGIVGEKDGRFLGTVRFWPIVIGGTCQALLLGPLAIDPSIRNQGCGLGLMRRGIERAAAAGHRLIILVGDPPYYARVGFKPVEKDRLTLPGPVDPSRILALELVPGALGEASGIVGVSTAAPQPDCPCRNRSSAVVSGPHDTR